MDPSLSHTDRRPPTKEAEEYIQEEIKSIRNGVGGLLIAGFALGRTCQIFSRSPGSCGVILQFAWIAAVAVQGFYFYGHAEKYGPIDAVPYGWLLAVQGFLWIIGVFKTRPRCAGIKDLGRGILAKYLPKLKPTICGILSDLIVCGLLIALFLLMNCPVQANWYKVMAGWILLCHASSALLVWNYRLRLKEARSRAKSWRKDIKGRHYL